MKKTIRVFYNIYIVHTLKSNNLFQISDIKLHVESLKNSTFILPKGDIIAVSVITKLNNILKIDLVLGITLSNELYCSHFKPIYLHRRAYFNKTFIF